MYSSNLALNYMSYPAQSLAKSCKLIPVMLMRIVVLGQRYRLHEYAQVLLITAGICIFMLFEDGKKGGKETSILGFLLCLFSLALDGFTGPTQERINAQHKPSSQ
jgi:solute carrier family 35 (UDP-galactose transporter), member B1